MKTLNLILSLLAASFVTQASASQVTFFCSGVQPNGKLITVEIHPLTRSTKADAVVVLKLDSNQEVAFPSRISGGTDVSTIYSSGAYGGMKIQAFDDDRAGQSWLWTKARGGLKLSCERLPDYS